jgi:hypothetical protein
MDNHYWGLVASPYDAMPHALFFKNLLNFLTKTITRVYNPWL